MTVDAINVSIVSRESGEMVLLLREGERWSLPRHRVRSPSAMNAELRRWLGLEIATLDRLRSPSREDPSTVFSHEALGGGAPRLGRWCSPEEVAAVELVVPADRDLLRGWFAAARTGPPWTRPGWFTATVAWADGELERLGLKRTGPAEQQEFRAWSGQLRLPVGDDAVYVKASPAAFGHEPAVTQLVARRCPDVSPHVLAADASRGLLLTADFGAPHRTRDTTALRDLYLRLAPELARIQRRTAGDLPDLLARGCPDHRLAALPALLGSLARGRTDLAVLTETLRRDCDELAALGIPESVVHHDIWRGNVAVREGRVLIFDWAESVVGHPFLSLDVLLRDVRAALPDDRATADAVCAAYLRGWVGDAPEHELRRAARLAVLPSIVSRALLWDTAVGGLDGERQRSYAGTVDAHLNRALDHVRGLS